VFGDSGGLEKKKEKDELSVGSRILVEDTVRINSIARGRCVAFD
jgi:hypothetical protein